MTFFKCYWVLLSIGYITHGPFRLAMLWAYHISLNVDNLISWYLILSSITVELGITVSSAQASGVRGQLFDSCLGWGNFWDWKTNYIIFILILFCMQFPQSRILCNNLLEVYGVPGRFRTCSKLTWLAGMMLVQQTVDIDIRIGILTGKPLFFPT